LSKPVFLKWLSKQGNHRWAIVWHWLQSQPAFKIVHSIQEFLHMPQKMEELKETEQRRQFQFTIYENNKKHLFQFIMMGIIGIGVGFYFSHLPFLFVAGGFTFISIIGFWIVRVKQKKWLKYMQEKQR
jgi:hypothetical protein